MKKTLLALLIFAVSAQAQVTTFLVNEKEVTAKFEEHQHRVVIEELNRLKRIGERAATCNGTNLTYVLPGGEPYWTFDLKKGRRYVFVTTTSGPAVQVIVSTMEGEVLYTSEIGNHIKVRFIMKESGTLKYKVASRSNSPGLHRTHGINVLNEGEKFLWEED